MFDIALSILGIYLFIFLGYVSKKIFKDELDEKSFVLFSIYFIQPMLIFWGLTTQEISSSVLKAPAVFTIVIFIALGVSYLLSRLIFSDQKDRSIATVASIVGNTGNLGIPLGIAIFGESSIIYTSIINLVNGFLVYSVGVYFYSRGHFSIRESLYNIFKLPIIWFGIVGLIFNYANLSLPSALELPLQMGAYATMVLQLSIFGMYLASVEVKKIEWKLFYFIGSMKFLLIPLLSFFVLNLFSLDTLVYNVILLELIVPLAVMNVNLASLYNCKPTQVAFLTFATSLLFLVYLFLVVRWIF